MLHRHKIWYPLLLNRIPEITTLSNIFCAFCTKFLVIYNCSLDSSIIAGNISHWERYCSFSIPKGIVQAPALHFFPEQYDLIFIDAVPKTSVGKFDKKVLRARYEMSGSQG
jgi:acyl-CoA synthetase (AMP-forming)/AMP-acid ligase II